MAIEMDGKVFSYGQTHMTVRSSREYLLSQDIAELAADGKKPAANSSTLDGAINTLGLDKISRSVQMVTLNLPKEEKDNLRRYFELQTGKAYHNYTLAMDCATMVMKALEKQTQMPVPGIPHTGFTIDASPSLVMMYMGMLKTLQVKNASGEALVGGINQITMAEKDRAVKHVTAWT